MSETLFMPISDFGEKIFILFIYLFIYFCKSAYYPKNLEETLN